MALTPNSRSRRSHVNLTGHETPERVRALSDQLRFRMVTALAKAGVPMDPDDITVVRHSERYSNAGQLVATADFDPPSQETRTRLVEAFDDGQRAGHEHARIGERGHPVLYRLLPLIGTSPYGPEADTDDPGMARCLDAAWMAGFDAGRAYERTWPGTGVHPPY